MPGLGVTSSKIGVLKSTLKYSCKYSSCNSAYRSNVSPTSQFKNKLFHRFPRHVISLSAWNKACQINYSKNSANLYLCNNHFSKDIIVISVNLQDCGMVLCHTLLIKNLLLSGVIFSVHLAFYFLIKSTPHQCRMLFLLTNELKHVAENNSPIYLFSGDARVLC